MDLEGSTRRRGKGRTADICLGVRPPEIKRDLGESSRFCRNYTKIQTIIFAYMREGPHRNCDEGGLWILS